MTEAPFEPQAMSPMPPLLKEKQSSNKGIWIIAEITIAAVVVITMVGAFLVIRSRSKDTPEEVVKKYIEARYDTEDVSVIEKLLQPEEVKAFKDAYGDGYKEKMRQVYCRKNLIQEMGVELNYDGSVYTNSYEEGKVAVVTADMQGTVTVTDTEGRTTISSLEEANITLPVFYLVVKSGGKCFINPIYEYTIYLSDLASQEDVQALMDKIKGTEYPPDLGIKYISKDDALEDFKKAHSEQPELWMHLEENPLPASFRIEYPSVISLIDIEQDLEADPRFSRYISEDSRIRAF